MCIPKQQLLIMEKLPQKQNTTAIDVYNPPAGVKAIAMRRQMATMPDVAKALQRVEKYVFVASTRQQIAEMDQNTLVAKTSQIFKFIAKDIGYNIPNDVNEWAYIQTRLVDVLTRYYSQLTLADVKLAFELATIGELDEYLPKDSQGNPDKKHYQQFNADYLSKILNAYKKKRQLVIGKAYDALPQATTRTPEMEEFYNQQLREKNLRYYKIFKETGKCNFKLLDAKFLYEWLLEKGFAQPLKETPEDRAEAYQRFMKSFADGFVNKYTASHVQREGVNSREIDGNAYDVAREREVKRAFERMVNAGVDIKDL